MAIDHIDHFQLVISNVDKAVDFYTRLGLTVASIAEPSATMPKRAYMKVGGGQEINLMTPEAVAAQHRTEDAGGGHFCLVWDGSEAELREHLAKNNVALRDRQPAPGQGTGAMGKGTSIFVNDPDGNSIEIIVYP